MPVLPVQKDQSVHRDPRHAGARPDAGRLVAPFPKRYDSQRGYYVLVAPHAQSRPDVTAFVAFLREQAVDVESTLDAAVKPRSARKAAVRG